MHVEANCDARTGIDTAIVKGAEPGADAGERRSRHRPKHTVPERCAEALADAGAAGEVKRGGLGDGERARSADASAGLGVAGSARWPTRR